MSVVALKGGPSIISILLFEFNALIMVSASSISLKEASGFEMLNISP
jgi:hypothetical protein